MKQISTSLTSKLKQDSVVERDYIVFSGETTKHYLWFNLYDDCYNNGNFIGTFVLKRIEITYSDSDLEFKNKEFNAYKEYKLDNGIWESINYGTFIVQAVKESDTKEEVKVTAYDYGLKFANTYETNLNYESNTVTLFKVLQEVCQKVGVELENTSIDNGNFIVDSNQFGENTLYGNVVTAIAQISCNFAKITPENKLKLLFKNESNIIIETKDYEEFEDKRDTLPYTAVSLGMSNVEGENVTLIAEGVDPDNAKYLTINDNPFAYTQDKRTQLIQAIFNKINGFGYSSFVLKNCLYPQLECGDLVQIKNKSNEIVNSIVLRPTFENEILNFEAPSTITSSVSYVQPLNAIEISKRTEIVVDKQNQTIQAVVESNQEVVNKTAQLTIEVDQLKGQISEVADVTTTADGYGSISADNINVSEPILLRIRPVGKDFACIYPRTNLYPSSTLYPKNRKITFENTTTNEKIEYTIPKDLWYFDSNNYDEFILDYENAQCYILHKVGVNADGTKYILEMPTTEYFDYPTISLTEGDYNIYTNSFNTAYIYVRLMTSNIYTSQFATKVELNSSITQTAKEINLEVSKKVDESEVISKINLSPETILIDTNKLNVNAIATFTNNKLATAGSTTINGSNITTGTIDASKVDVTNLTADNITSGNINGNNVTITNLDANNITSGTLNGSKVDVTNLNASNITGGTLSADKISGGTISASTVSLKNVILGTSTSKISGWNLGTSAIYSTSANVDSYIYSNGDVMFGGNYGMIKFDTDPVRITTAYKMLISDRYSASAIYNPNDTINIRCYNGTLHLNSSYGVYANDTLLASSSSKNVKKNIKRLSKRKIEELYENVKKMPSYEYNYKKKYCGGQKNNYGFIIEDFENSILGKILHVTQNQEDKNIKSYSYEDLTRVNTILIQELMKKIDKLEKENIELRRKIDGKD